MGSQPSKRVSYSSQCQEAVQMYMQNLYASNRKSQSQFKEQIQSIKKKSSYFKYPWIKSFLTQVDEEHLYYEYTSVLKENCIREGRKIAPLLPNVLRQQFLKSFLNKYRNTNKNSKNDIKQHVSNNIHEDSNQNESKKIVLTDNLINEAVDECKCYTLITKWLNQLVTINNLKGKQNPPLHLQKNKGIEQAYFILNKLIQERHASYKEQQSIGFVLEDELLKKYVLSYRENIKFQEKEIIIKRIISRIESLEKRQNNVQYFDQILLGISKDMGFVKSYAVIKLVRELGSVDIQRAWKVMNAQISK